MFADVVQQYVVDFQYPKLVKIMIISKENKYNILLDCGLLNVQFDKINFRFQLQVELEYFQTKIIYY